MLDSAIKHGYFLLHGPLPLTSRFYQDVTALEQTKAVLMSFLDPEPANNPAVDLLAEPQCNLLVPGRGFIDDFYRPAKPDRAFPYSVISSYIYLVVDDFLRRLHEPHTKKIPERSTIRTSPYPNFSQDSVHDR
jgi:hypothetical protein